MPSPAPEVALRPLCGLGDWAAFHDIRRAVLWQARERDPSRYDPHHPDDRKSANIPLLLWRGREAIGAMRLDLLNPWMAALRTVAVHPERQRCGFGTSMVTLAVDLAHGHGRDHLVVNSALEAVGFYRRLGFREENWPDAFAAANASVVVQMGWRRTTPL